MVKIKKFIQVCLFEWRKKRAIRKAQRSADLHRRKFLVSVWGGKPVVISMQGVRKLVRQHRFAKGFTTEKARKLAIFEACPKAR